MGTPPLMVEILPEIGGVDFDDAWARRVEASVDADGQTVVPFISSDDLTAAKVSAGRSQDLADVAAIRKARSRSG